MFACVLGLGASLLYLAPVVVMVLAVVVARLRYSVSRGRSAARYFFDSPACAAGGRPLVGRQRRLRRSVTFSEPFLSSFRAALESLTETVAGLARLDREGGGAEGRGDLLLALLDDGRQRELALAAGGLGGRAADRDGERALLELGRQLAELQPRLRRSRRAASSCGGAGPHGHRRRWLPRAAASAVDGAAAGVAAVGALQVAGEVAGLDVEAVRVAGGGRVRAPTSRSCRICHGANAPPSTDTQTS